MTEAWWWLDTISANVHDIGDRVDDHAHHPFLNDDDHDDGRLVVNGLFQVELLAKVNNGHNGSPKIEDTNDFWRSIGDSGGRNIPLDFLNLENVDTVFFVGEREGEELIRIRAQVGTFVR